MTSETIYNKIKCDTCNKEFSKKGIFTHLIRMHGTDEQKSVFVNSSSTLNASIKHKINNRDKTDKYYLCPTKCKQCNIELDHDKRNNKFCNNSCAAKFNNLNRSPDAKKTGPAKKPKEPKPLFSKLHKCVCKHCGLVWYGRYEVRICVNHSHLYSCSGRALFSFTFKLVDHPLLFDLSIIKKYGMRSQTNIYGVVRDHKVSVYNALKNGYDPYYIRHPVNCELMLASDNSRKHTMNSITYNELVEAVKKYDSR